VRLPADVTRELCPRTVCDVNGSSPEQPERSGTALAAQDKLVQGLSLSAPSSKTKGDPDDSTQPSQPRLPLDPRTELRPLPEGGAKHHTPDPYPFLLSGVRDQVWLPVRQAADVAQILLPLSRCQGGKNRSFGPGLDRTSSTSRTRPQPPEHVSIRSAKQVPSRSEPAAVVSVLVSVASVHPCPPRLRGRRPTLIETARTQANSRAGDLESELGSRPRGFESRILRPWSAQESAARPQRSRRRFCGRSLSFSLSWSVAATRGARRLGSRPHAGWDRLRAGSARPSTSTTSPSRP
jgi:hypothetical protein